MTQSESSTPLRAVVRRWPAVLGLTLLAFLASGILGTLFALLATGLSRLIVTVSGTVTDTAATAIVALGALLIVLGISIPLLMAWAAAAALAISPGSRRRPARMLLVASARVPALLGAALPLALITVVGVTASLVLLPLVLIAIPLWLAVVLLRRRLSPGARRILTIAALALTPFGALVYWLLCWSQWLPRIALRGEGPFEAMRRSAAVVRPRWNRTARRQASAALIGLSIILGGYGLLVAATLAGVDAVALGIAGGLLMFAATTIGGAIPVAVAARDLAEDGLGGSLPTPHRPRRGLMAATATVMAPILIVTTLVLPGAAGVAHAEPGPATVVVTDFTDAAAPGVGECAEGNACTLRGALTLLNDAGEGGTVRFAASGTISLVAPLVATVPVLIDGGANSVTISGGDATAVLYVDANTGPAMTAGVRNITIANGHQSDTNAGAGFSFWTSNGSSAVVEGVTFRSNDSNGPGSAIYSQGAMQIVNSTFDGNRSTGDYYSSAVYHEGNQPMSIVNSTLHDGGGIAGYGSSPPITVNNSIVMVSAGYWSCRNVVGGGNLANSDSTACGTNPVNTSDAGLGALDSYGGPTQTMALQPGSPAIGVGLAEYCPAVDQRGVVRQGTLGCDAGSYQRDDTTITRMTSSHATTQYSEQVTIDVSVATPGSPGTPDGTVTLSVDGGTFETATLDGNATAGFTLPKLDPGNHIIEATYAPTSGSTLIPSNSQFTLQVVPAATRVSLTINPDGSAASTPLGEDLTLVAQVRTQATNLPVPGTVTFLDGDTVLGTAIATDGVASLVVSGLDAGPHSITARYDGETRFDAATSTAAAHNVLASSTTTLTITPDPVPWSSTATVSAVVSGPLTGRVPTGTVTVAVDGRTGVITLDPAGHGSTVFPADVLGAHDVDAAYSGDGYHAYSVSDATVDVVEAHTTTTLSLDLADVAYGTSVRATALIEPQHVGVRTPTGDVRFIAPGGIVLGTAPLVDGTAVLDTAESGITALTPGSYAITALYLPDEGLAGSADTADITVNMAQTVTTLDLAADTAVFGEPVVATVTVETADGVPVREGTVTLRTENAFMSLVLPGITTFGASSAGTVYAVADVIDGKASIVIDDLAVSAHDVTAVFSSSTGYVGSNSASVPLTIAKAQSTLTATIGETATFGESISVTALVESVAPSHAIPTGEVQIRDGVSGDSWGSASLDGTGEAIIELPRLEPGTHSATVTFPATATHEASSAPITITVERAVAGVTLALTSPDWEYGSVHRATVSVAGLSDAPGTGTITLVSAGSAVATGTLVDGVAVIDVSSLAVGDHPITAVFGGHSRYRPAESTAVTASVTRASSVVTVSSSENPAPRTTPLTFTIAVTSSAAAGPPTGQVRVLDGTTELAVVNLEGGTASVTGVNLAPGAHQITAEYVGNALAAPNVSAAISQVVAPVAPTLTFSTSPASPAYGQDFDIVVMAVDPLTGNAIPNMSVWAHGYGTQLTSSTGAARFTVDRSVRNIEPGEHTVTVTAHAIGVHPETTLDFDYTMHKAPVTMRLDASGATTAHQTGTVYVYLTLSTVDDIAPLNGRVVLYKDDVMLPGAYMPVFSTTGSLVGGIAQIPHLPNMVGSFELRAEYVGDYYYAGATASPHVVRNAPTHIDVVAPKTEARIGDTVPIEFDVDHVVPAGQSPSGPALTGTVTVSDWRGPLCSVTLPASTCDITLRDLGTHNFLVSYSGDGDFAASAFLAPSISVSEAITAISASITSPTPQTTRDRTSIEWSIDRDLADFPEARVVASLDGGTVLCDELASAGGCSFQLTETQRGTRAITLTYTPGRYGYATASHSLWGVNVQGCYTVRLPLLESSTASEAPSCGAGTGYLDGTLLTVTADLDEGAEVLEWRRDGELRENPFPYITFRVTADTVLEVYTSASCVTLTLPTSYVRNARHEPGTGGYLLPLTDPNCGQSAGQAESEVQEGSARYAYGTTVAVRAFPAYSKATENILYEWSDGHARTEVVRSVTLTEDRTIDATFGQTCYAGPIVTAGQGGSAAIVASTFRSDAWFTDEYEWAKGRCSSPLGDGYVLGTEVTLEAVPASLRNPDGSWSADDASYYFTEWRHNAGVALQLTSAPLAVTALGEASRYQPVRTTVTVGAKPTYSYAAFAHVQCYRLDVGVKDAVDAVLLYEGTTVPTVTRSIDSSCAARGDGWYAPGTKVTLTPQTQSVRYAYYYDEVAKDYVRTQIIFGGWSGDLSLRGDGTLTTYTPTVTVDRDLTISADWVLTSNACLPVTLHTQPAQSGTVSAAGYNEGCRPGAFHRNSVVKVSAEPPGDYLTIWHNRSNDGGESVYSPGQNKFEYRVSAASVATAWFCGRITPSVSVRGLDGKVRPLASDAVSPFFDYTRDGMCPIDGFYLPDSTPTFSLADTASVSYALLGFTVDGEKMTGNAATVSFANGVAAHDIHLDVEARCSELTVVSDGEVTRSLEPNCPGAPDPVGSGSTWKGWYLEGSELTLFAHDLSHHDFTGWSGAATASDPVVRVSINGSTTVSASYSEHGFFEQAYDVVVAPAVDAIGVLAKKSIAYISAAVEGIAMSYASFLTIGSLVLQGIDEMLMEFGLEGGIGDDMKSVMRFMDDTVSFMTAFTRCAAEWSHGGGSNTEYLGKGVAASRTLLELTETGVDTVWQKLQATKSGLTVAASTAFTIASTIDNPPVWESSASDAWSTGGDEFTACVAGKTSGLLGLAR